jgi:putative ABC transport system permease protein
MGAALVLGATAASRQLFVSSVATAELRSEVETSSPSGAGLTVTAGGPLAPDRLTFRDRSLREAVTGIPGLDPTILSVVAFQDVEVSAPARPRIDMAVAVATRTGFVPHLRVQERGEGGGWWIAVSVADRLRVHPGDAVRVELPGGPVDLQVSGVYQDLSRLPVTNYWSPIGEFIYKLPGEDSPPPPFLLGDLDSLLGLLVPAAPEVHFQWEFPVAARGLTLPEATNLSGALERVQARLSDPTLQLGAGFSSYQSALPSLARRAQEAVAALRGPIEAIGLAGALVSLMVFMAAGTYGLTSRRSEYGMLHARGLGPVSMGIRAAVEALLPAALAGVGGWALALAVVRAWGPADRLASDALRGSVRDSAIGVALGIVLLGAVVGVAVRGMEERRVGRVRRAASRMPWEAITLGLAVAALYEILTRGTAPVGSAGGVPPEVDLLVPLFPVLFIGGLGGLVVRGLRRALPRLRTAGSRWSHPLYLAGRRLAATPSAALLLVMLSALSVGIVTYAGIFTSSVRATADGKAHVFVGGDASLTVSGPVELSGPVGRRATMVVRMPVATIPGESVDVMAIDPETFARGAFWDEGFSDTPLPELLARLETGGSDPLPVLVAGGRVPPDPTLSLIGTDVPARVVGEMDAFPGMGSSFPLVVADAEQMEAALGSSLLNFDGVYQVWVEGDPAPVAAQLRAQAIVPDLVLTVAEVRDTPRFTALSWIFRFLQALGVVVGVVALVSLLLYLQARQRAREVSYALARRMGLSPRAHRWSVTVEVTAMLASAFALGGGLAALAVFLIHRKVEFMPGLPPSPLFRLPPALYGAVAAVMLVAAWAGAHLVQRRADRVNVAEVMRLAG